MRRLAGMRNSITELKGIPWQDNDRCIEKRHKNDFKLK